MKVTLNINEKTFKAAKTYAASQDVSLSEVVDKALTSYMPTFISVINPREDISPTYQAKINQAQELVSSINAGTAPMNSLVGGVTQKMSEGLTHNAGETNDR